MAPLHPAISPYVYCDNKCNPLNKIDPTGLDWVPMDIDGEEQLVYVCDPVTVTAERQQNDDYIVTDYGVDFIEYTNIAEERPTVSPLNFAVQTALAFIPNIGKMAVELNEADFSSRTNMLAEYTDKACKLLQKKGIAITPPIKLAVLATVASILSKPEFNLIGPDIPVHEIYGAKTDTLLYNPRVAGVIMEVIHHGDGKNYTEVFRY